MNELVIDGVRFPVAYNGYSFARHKIWSRNTGRTSSGTMVGTIIAIKNEVQAKLQPISLAQAEVLDRVASDKNKSYVTVKYLALNGTQKEMRAYLDDVTYPVLGTSINKGEGLITGVTVTVIEK